MSPLSSVPVVGDKLGSSYYLRALLHSAPGTLVFHAVQESIGRDVLLKALTLTGKADSLVLQRFKREIIAGKSVSHPNVAFMLDADDKAQTPYFVTTFVDGSTLSDHLARKGPLPTAEFLDIANQLLSGLQAIHQAGIVHRDIKPANILIDRQGKLTIIDFGIAFLRSEKDPLTEAGFVYGTPRYVSPEQARGQGNESTSDIYSAGLVMYEMLTGRSPFSDVDDKESIGLRSTRPAPDLREIIPDASPTIADAVMKALEVDPSKRWVSAAEMQSQLETASKNAAQGTTRLRHIREPGDSDNPRRSDPARWVRPLGLSLARGLGSHGLPKFGSLAKYLPRPSVSLTHGFKRLFQTIGNLAGLAAIILAFILVGLGILSLLEVLGFPLPPPQILRVSLMGTLVGLLAGIGCSVGQNAFAIFWPRQSKLDLVGAFGPLVVLYGISLSPLREVLPVATKGFESSFVLSGASIGFLMAVARLYSRELYRLVSAIGWTLAWLGMYLVVVGAITVVGLASYYISFIYFEPIGYLSENKLLIGGAISGVLLGLVAGIPGRVVHDRPATQALTLVALVITSACLLAAALSQPIQSSLGIKSPELAIFYFSAAAGGAGLMAVLRMLFGPNDRRH